MFNEKEKSGGKQMIILKIGQMVQIKHKAKVRAMIAKENKIMEEHKTPDGVTSKHPVIKREFTLCDIVPIKENDSLVQVDGMIERFGKYVVRSVRTGNKYAISPKDVNHIFKFLY
jgi:hypothetical protein